MEEISLKRPESVPIEALARATAKMLLQFFTSLTANTCLAAVALVSLMMWLISDGHAGGATWCILWILHFAIMSGIDIYTKGGAQ